MGFMYFPDWIIYHRSFKQCDKEGRHRGFSFTYELFAVISSLFLCWLPEYLFRMIRSRMTKEQFKNAGKVWKTMFVYAAVIGVLGSLFFYILSKIMEITEVS